MDPNHALITIVAIVALFVGRAVLENHLEHRRKTREMEVKSEADREQLRNIRFMSEQETSRMQVMARLVESGKSF